MQTKNSAEERIYDDYLSIIGTNLACGSISVGAAGALITQIPVLPGYSDNIVTPSLMALFSTPISQIRDVCEYKTTGGRIVGAASYFIGAMLGQGIYLAAKYNIPELLK